MGTTRLPPRVKGYPVLGNVVALLRDPLGFAIECARIHGDMVQIHVGSLPIILVTHPTNVEEVLRGKHRSFVKDRGTRLLSSVLGQGLVTSEGDFWRRQRRLATPAFQTEAVQKYSTLMVERTLRHLAQWRPGQQRDLHADLMRLTAEIVAQTLFSSSVAENAELVADALRDVLEYFAGPGAFVAWWDRVPTPGNWNYHRAVRRIDRIILDAIARRRLATTWPDDLLSRLMNARDEEGHPMSDRQLRDELATLFLAGHETTAVALSFCFSLLGRHPEATARLQAELETVLKGRPPTVADLPRLRYTEGVVKEAMRLYPPVPSIGREAIHDCEIGGYAIPQGTQLALVQWVVHRDPRWYPEPEAFRPERWESDWARQLPRGAYFPFGDGPRVCIGQGFAMMEAVLILATVASRWRCELLSQRPPLLLPSVTLRPRGGIRVRVQPLSSTR